VPEEQRALEKTAGRLVNQPSDIPSSSLLVRASALHAGGPGREPWRRYFQHTTLTETTVRLRTASGQVLAGVKKMLRRACQKLYFAKKWLFEATGVTHVSDKVREQLCSK